MNICVPVETKDVMDPKVCASFGGAPFYAMVDIMTSKTEFIGNSDLRHKHGQCIPLSIIDYKSVISLLVRDIGAMAVEHLNARRIKVYRVPECSLYEAIELYKREKLPEILPSDPDIKPYCH